MPVGAYAGANVSNGNGVTTLFPYNFKILDQTHIEVKVNGVLKVLGADYTVTGVGLSNGGNVVFGVAPANLTVVQRARKVPYVRTTDYQANGDLREDTLDTDLDLEEMQLQQIAADIARGFKAPLSVTADQVLTDAMWAARANMLLGFDGAGAFGVFVGVNAALVSAFMATVLDDADAATAAATLAVIAKAIGTAKGDIIGFTGNATPVRKAVGTDFFDLAADASQADGLSYRKPVAAIGDGRNIAARTNAATPNTKLDITADELVVRAANGGAVVLQTVNVTIDFGAAVGANGPDAAGAQTASAWSYGWIIAKPDGTVAGLGSASATAPTMPAGYTMKALVTSARSTAGPVFIKYRQFGNWCYYEARNDALLTGTATVETAVSVASFVPPIAEAMMLEILNNTAAPLQAIFWRFVAGSSFYAMGEVGRTCLVMPNVGQQFLYLLAGAPGSGGASAEILAFKLPLGGE